MQPQEEEKDDELFDDGEGIEIIDFSEAQPLIKKKSKKLKLTKFDTAASSYQSTIDSMSEASTPGVISGKKSGPQIKNRLDLN